MRVAWLALEWPRPGVHVGGVGRYLERLADRMREKVELSVVTYEGVQPMAGVTFVTIPEPRSRLGRYYGSAARVRSVVAATEPDVVHAHGDDFLLAHSSPTVRTFYGTSWSEAVASRGLRRWNHAVLAGTERLSARRADRTLAIGVDSMEAFHCDEIIPPYLGHTQTPQRNATETTRLAFIGSFHGRKQGWLAQEAVDDLRRTMAAELVVVGPSSDAENWAPWVDHRASLDDTEVSDVLASSWALLAPSTYEGFGIPTVEALAHELAVVALPNPGMRYITGLAGAELPVALVAADAFSDAVADRVARGPILTAHERRAADACVAEIVRRGSVDHLVDIYKRLVASTS